MQLTTLTFRFRGPMDWKRICKETKHFFASRQYDFAETNYKDKTNEFEGKWHADKKIDMYTEMVYDIDFKAVDMGPTTMPDGQPGYNGKLWVRVEVGMNENYGSGGIAGKKEIFPADSWLHKVYKKVTYREREEDTAGVAIITGQQYLAMLKSLCAMEAK